MAGSAEHNAREDLFAEIEAATNPRTVLKHIEDVEIGRAVAETDRLRKEYNVLKRSVQCREIRLKELSNERIVLQRGIHNKKEVRRPAWFRTSALPRSRAALCSNTQQWPSSKAHSLL